MVDGKNAATLLNTPFDLQAVDRGMVRLGSAGQLLGSYQGHAAAAQRGWLAQNEAAAIGVMRAYREAMEWIYDPKNREIAEALLVANDREMTPALARRTLVLENKRLSDELDEQKKAIVVLKQKLAKAGIIKKGQAIVCPVDNDGVFTADVMQEMLRRSATVRDVRGFATQ